MQVSLEGRVLFLFLFLSLVCIRMQSRQEKSSVNLDCDGGFLRLSKCLRSNGIPVSCSENDSHSSSAFIGEVRELNPCFYLPLSFFCSVFEFCFSPGFLRKGSMHVVFYDYYFATIGKCCIFSFFFHVLLKS